MSEFSYAACPEQTLFIDLPDTDLKIKGILRGELTGPLIILMHGRPGTGNDLLHYLGARYLYESGFNSLRLFMYDEDDRTRDLIDCTLQTHVDDFEAVVEYARQQGVEAVFAIGHSYGGLTIVTSKADLSGAVLWDPSHGLSWQNEPSEPDETTTDVIIKTAGKGSIVSKAMHEQDVALGDTTQLAAHITYPLAVITAGKGVLNDLSPRYTTVAQGATRSIVIPEATHNFRDSDEITLRLFTETTAWLKEIA